MFLIFVAICILRLVSTGFQSTGVHISRTISLGLNSRDYRGAAREGDVGRRAVVIKHKPVLKKKSVAAIRREKKRKKKAVSTILHLLPM